MKEILQKLELSLLQVEVRQSREKLDDIIADDFREITSSGKIFDKKHMLEDLPNMVLPEFTVHSFEIKELLQDIFQTIFEVEKRMNSVSTQTLRSSIWRKTPMGWKMFFHQGTVIKK